MIVCEVIKFKPALVPRLAQCALEESRGVVKGCIQYPDGEIMGDGTVATVRWNQEHAIEACLFDHTSEGQVIGA